MHIILVLGFCPFVTRTSGGFRLNLPPEHPTMSFETREIKMAAVSAKDLLFVDYYLREDKSTCGSYVLLLLLVHDGHINPLTPRSD